MIEGTGAIVTGARAAGATWRWWRKRPAQRARYRTDSKVAIDAVLPRDPDDRNYRGEVIVRDLRRQNPYPDLDEDIAGRGVSPWFKAEVKGLYDRGIEIYLANQRVMIRGDVATEVREGGQPVVVVGRISFDRIDHIDPIGDADTYFYPMPHLYCRFGWRGRRLYEDTVLYRAGVPGSGVLVHLEGVTLQQEKWLSRREIKAANRAHHEATRPAREQLEANRRIWLEGPQDDALDD